MSDVPASPESAWRPSHTELPFGSPDRGCPFRVSDTPETKDRRKPVQCFGPEASAYTHARLSGRRVSLETDSEVRDKYGRVLAYVYVDGVRFDDELLRLGRVC